MQNHGLYSSGSIGFNGLRAAARVQSSAI
jgi:hypothetical protein